MVSANPRFHRSEEEFREQCEKVLSRRRDEGTITKRDEELIRLFLIELRATAGISNSRAAKLTGLLAGARRWIGPYDQVKTSEMYLAIDKINNIPDFTKNTKADISRGLKRFCIWLCETGYADPDLQKEKVLKIKPQSYSKTSKTAEDLLTEEEVRLLIEHANTTRDRAIIGMLYEGGFRIGEIGELKWKQVTFNDWNIAICTDFKTGKSRHIPLVMSRSYLQAWANEYPGQHNSDSFVFLTRREQPIQYWGVVKMLRTTAERAGVKRHITPHIFRHSRITHLIRQGYQESIIKKMMWGNISTDMFAVYLHLVDDDIDNEIAQKLGIKKSGRPSKESKALEPLQCSRCYTVNGPTSRFCDQCGNPLTVSAVEEVEQTTAILNGLLIRPDAEELIKGIVARLAKIEQTIS